MLQCLHNRRFLLRRTLRHFRIFLLRQIIVLSHIQPALPLDLGNIQAGYLQTILLQHIRLDLVIGRLALRSSQIQLVQIQLHLDMLLGVEFGQKHYRLDVFGLGEHIQREDGAQLVIARDAALRVGGVPFEPLRRFDEGARQNAEVAREGGRVAGDHRHLRDARGEDGAQRAAVDAFAGRVDDEERLLRRDLLQQAGQLVFHFAADVEQLALEAVGLDEAVGAGGGFLHHLDAVRLAHLAGEHGGEQPAAAVCVDDHLGAAVQREADGALVQLAADAAVDLHEGVGADLEVDAELVRGVPALAVQQAEGVAVDAVAGARIDVLPEGEGLEFFAEQRDEAVCLRERFGGGDGGDEEAAVDVAHDDVAEHPLAGALVVGAHAAGGHVAGEDGDDVLRPARVDGAAGDGHDAVAALGVEADDAAAVFVDADGDLEFVAVLELIVAFDGERHLPLDAGDLAEGVLHRLALEFELGAVADVLDLAAAAAGEQRAARADALVGGGQDLERLGVADAVFDLERAELDLFARDREGSEKDGIAHMYDPLSVAAERLDEACKFLIFSCDLRPVRHTRSLTFFAFSLRGSAAFTIFAAGPIFVLSPFALRRKLAEYVGVLCGGRGRIFFAAPLFAALAPRDAGDGVVDQTLAAAHQPIVKHEQYRAADADEQVCPIEHPIEGKGVRPDARHGAKERPRGAHRADEPRVFDEQRDPSG